MSDRKYGQRGYGESYHQREEPRSRPKPSGPRPDRFNPDRPRGRGLGAPDTEVFRCRDCGTKQALDAEISLDATCSKCGAALHSCTHCSYFDTAARFECRQEIPARQPSKTKANSCEFFTPRRTQEFSAEKAAPGDARSAFDALFKL